MTYGDFKDLPRRTASDKVLHDKTFNIAKSPKYDRYQHGLLSMVFKIADHAKTSSRRHNWYVNETDLFETSL